MASDFGKTWWGEQWLNSLNNIDYSNRLPRGASYARKGAVEKIKVTGNHITAKVRGRRPSPYKVDIILPPFFDPELGNFMADFTKRPVIISKLLNRELDPVVLELAQQHGLKVFPGQWNDLKMQCSCPDWAVPCKHLASVIYKVSAEIDNNPFLVFSLHNVDLFSELEKLGIFINKQHIEIPKIQDLFFGKKKVDKKYNPEQAYRKLSLTKLEPIHGPLTSLLSPNPAFYTASGSDFRDKYLSTLNRIVKNTQRAASGKIALPEFFAKAWSEEQHIGYHTTNQVRLDESLKAKILYFAG
ncbi:MAG: SWIM zinc finger family protein [Mariniphaga sp.]|nr:SWIM zinc finger family protein [Mariniphaga sp.]